MRKLIVKIDGMMCGHCEAHINDVIRNKFNVKSVASSHKKGETEIITENEIKESELRNAIESQGYTFISVSSEPYEKKGLFSILKK